MSEKMEADPCPRCGDSLIAGKAFCANCGQPIAPNRAVIDSYVEARIEREVTARFKAQNALVGELADSAEDVVWRRLKRYSVICGLLATCILGVLTFLGLNTLHSVSTRIEPIVSAAEKRAQAAKQTVEQTAGRVEVVKASIDRLSKDVDEQTRRLAAQGEISHKLDNLQSAADAALRKVEAYRARSEELSDRVEHMMKSLEVRVAQVSKEVDTLSVKKTYPTLGQPMYVTFNGEKWKGVAGKGPNEKWVSIDIALMSAGKYTSTQIETLVSALKAEGYTPLLGLFGVAGPYNANFAFLGSANFRGKTTVLYFNRSSEKLASRLCEILSRTVGVQGPQPSYVDATPLPKDDPLAFVLRQAGLDAQIALP